jgi:hypothetical protein
MSDQKHDPAEIPANPAPLAQRPLSEAAKRALAEAEERRTARAQSAATLGPKKEINGRGGPDPVRYGDWEVKGLTSDF